MFPSKSYVIPQLRNIKKCINMKSSKLMLKNYFEYQIDMSIILEQVPKRTKFKFLFRHLNHDMVKSWFNSK